MSKVILKTYSVHNEGALEDKLSVSLGCKCPYILHVLSKLTVF